MELPRSCQAMSMGCLQQTELCAMLGVLGAQLGGWNSRSRTEGSDRKLR